MTKQVKIGCYSAFWGDSPVAVKQFLAPDAPQLDYVVADYLAELTMGLLARSARFSSSKERSRSNRGYIAEFLNLVIAPNLDQILEKNIKIVTNAGGLDPVGLKAAIDAHVHDRRLGDRIKVAAVSGDDLLPRQQELISQGAFEGFDPLSGAGSKESDFRTTAASDSLLSLNAYLGAEPITKALQQGANIVVTGRCVDSALVVGPLAHEFGWSYDTFQQNLDRLAAASLAGHVIECGAQATGGNYTDWRTSATSPHGGWANMGYPILTFNADASFLITKPPRTGGVVNTRSVCEQMLYEVLDPENYVLPDVVVDMSNVHLEAVAPDTVLVSGAKGKPPTPWLKCTAVEQRGHRINVDLLFCGEEAESKAQTLGKAIIARTNALASKSLNEAPIGAEDHAIIIIGAEHSLGHAPTGPRDERREVVLRVAARHRNRAVLDTLGMETAAFLTNSCPGICMLTSGRPKSSPNLVCSSVLVDRGFVQPKTWTSGSDSSRVDGVSVPLFTKGCQPVSPPASRLQASTPSDLKTTIPRPGSRRVKLHEVAFGRSGDKGDTANVAIMAKDPAFYPDLLAQLTPDVVFSAFKHFIAPGGTVTRFEVPGVHAVNFVLTKALGGGGLSSLRVDRQAKSYAQVALSCIEIDVTAVDMPGPRL